MELLLAKFIIASVVAITFVIEATSYFVSFVVCSEYSYGPYVSDPYGFWNITWVEFAIATTAPGKTLLNIPSRTILSIIVQFVAACVLNTSRDSMANPTNFNLILYY